MEETIKSIENKYPEITETSDVNRKFNRFRSWIRGKRIDKALNRVNKLEDKIAATNKDILSIEDKVKDIETDIKFRKAIQT